MAKRLTVRQLRNRIRSVNRRLTETLGGPCNADRALWGALAAVTFASATGQREDVQTDPETVLGDLLADLMHWCDVQKTNDNLEGSIEFKSALERARNHYTEECAEERERLQAEREQVPPRVDFY